MEYVGPNFPLMKEMKEEDAAQDFLAAMTKVRWARMGMEIEEIVRERDEGDIAEEERIEKIIKKE